MHTIIVLAGALGLLIATSALGHAWGEGMPGLVKGLKLFIPLWFACAFLNMWIGVRHGYSWGEELPIFLGIFAVPAFVASLLWWKLS